MHATTFLIIPMASYRALELGVPPEGLGLLPTAFSIPPLLVALRVGRIVDRRGGLPFIVGGLSLMALSGLFLALAPSAPWIFVAFSGLGLGHLTGIVATQGMVAQASSDGSYDHRFASLSLAVSFGQLIGPALGGLVAGEGSPEGTVRALLVGAVLACTGLPVALVLRRRSAPGLIRSAAGGPGSAERAGSGPREPRAGGGKAPSVREILRTPGLLWAIVVSATVLSATDIVITYLPALGEERLWPASLVGALLALRAASSMAVRIVLGRLSARFGRARVLGGAMAVSAAAFLLLPFTEPLPLVVVLMAAMGAGLGIGQPMTLAWVASLAAPSVRGTAMSVRMVGNRLGEVALPAVAGGMAAVGGVGGVLAATGLMVGAGITGVVRGLRGEARPPD
jgi:predicted MFS family arabinose efflux permease